MQVHPFFLLIFCLSYHLTLHQTQQNLLGGYIPLNLTNIDALFQQFPSLAHSDQAAKKYFEENNGTEISDLLQARYQIVGGVNYRLVYQVDEKFYEIEVRTTSWENFLQLIKYEEVVQKSENQTVESLNETLSIVLGADKNMEVGDQSKELMVNKTEDGQINIVQNSNR